MMVLVKLANQLVELKQKVRMVISSQAMDINLLILMLEVN